MLKNSFLLTVQEDASFKTSAVKRNTKSTGFSSSTVLAIALMLSLLVNGGNTFQSCEESTEHCICSMKATLQYLDEKAVVSRSILSREPDAVLHRIQKYQCIQYEQLPEALIIKWTGQSRLPSRRRRFRRSDSRNTGRFNEKRSKRGYTDLLGEIRNSDSSLASRDLDDTRRDLNHQRILSKRYPRDTVKPIGYPSDEVMSEVIPRLPQKSQHQYVPLGSEAILKCFSPQDVVEESSWLDRKFHWFHSDGREVSAPEMFLDKETGDLTLKAVQLTDTDKYTCKVTYRPGEDSFQESSPTEEILEHQYQLDVIAESIAWLRFAVIYSGETCNQDEMLLIQENVLLWVQKYVCHFCPIRNHSVSCVAHDLDRVENDDESRTYRDIRIRFAMSTLGLEHRTTSFAVYSEACPLTCVETLHVKLLQIAQISLEKLFRLEIDLESSLTGTTSTYSSQPETIDSDVAVGCPSGFFSNYKLCFPCPAGTFSPNGNTDCSKCPIGHFQPTPGSSLCFPCPDGYSTAGEGSIAMFECKTEYFVAAVNAMESNWFSKATGSVWFGGIIIISGLLCPVIISICLIPYFCPKSKLGRWFAPCSCCAPDPDFELLEDDKGNSTDGDGSETTGQTDDETYSNKKKWNWKHLGKKKTSTSRQTPKTSQATLKNKETKETLKIETEKSPSQADNFKNTKSKFTVPSPTDKNKSKDNNLLKAPTNKLSSKKINDLMAFHDKEQDTKGKAAIEASTSASDLKWLQSGSVQTSNPKLLSTRTQTSKSKLMPSIFTQTSKDKFNLQDSQSTQTKKNVTISREPPLMKYITSSSESGTDSGGTTSPRFPAYGSRPSSRVFPAQSSSTDMTNKLKPIDDFHDLHINIDERKKKLEESILKRKNHHHHRTTTDDDSGSESNNDKSAKVLLPPWSHPKYHMLRQCNQMKPQHSEGRPTQTNNNNSSHRRNNPSQSRNDFHQNKILPPPPPPPRSIRTT